MASISSMKIMEGDWERAWANRSLQQQHQVMHEEVSAHTHERF
jgi:hypothetical protein